MAKHLTTEQRDALLALLQKRFEDNMPRHPGAAWAAVQTRLEAAPEKLWSLSEMERTGGEPDVAFIDEGTREYIFCDCAPESPAGRRNLCYDRAALDARKANKPMGSAVEAAAGMGVALLDEAQYRTLQRLDAFDVKTSSWIATPEAIRQHGGALFCDRRYDHVFTYHNGADSYYAARGFRAALRL